MKKRQIDVYDMFLAVENHFDDNPTVWESIVPIAETKNLFTAELDALAEEVAVQLVNPTGITADKDAERTNLENQSFALSAGISSYASINKKNDLYRRCFYSRTDLTRFRDAELLGVCTNLSADCTAELANLAAFGITDASVTTFNNSIAAFGAIMKNPADAIAKRKAATKNIEDMIPQITDVLNTRMDNLVVMLSASHPEFLASYNNLRAINSTGSNTMSLTITTLNAATNKPIANVNLELVGQGIKRVSSERGYNTVINLVSGSHEIKAMHPNYKTKSETFTVVSGETTELVLLLEAL